MWAVGLYAATLWGCSAEECPAELRWADADGDGYGDPTRALGACEPGGVDNRDDCDDADPRLRPDAEDRCDGVDQDCDGEVDEDEPSALRYADLDRDGWGSPVSWRGCGVPPPFFTALSGGDCDDLDPAVNPRADDVCDGIDNDCDGEVDRLALGRRWFLDHDLDGYGWVSIVSEDCDPGEGYVELGGDCNDAASDVHPGAVERCNLRDDDCDGVVDEDPVEGFLQFIDVDSDGFGGDDTVVDCVIEPEVLVPGVGLVRARLLGGDCDDGDVSVNPNAPERCNGVDDDCDGRIDDEDSSLDYEDRDRFFADADRDGWGDDDVWAWSCAQPLGFVPLAGDCDDEVPAVRPDATERCNGIDDDCDGWIDGDDPDAGGCP